MQRIRRRRQRRQAVHVMAPRFVAVVRHAANEFRLREEVADAVDQRLALVNLDAERAMPAMADVDVGARINGRLVPLRTALNNGDIVEIETDPNSRPSPTWLSFVRTGKARSAIRHYLRTINLNESVELGRELPTAAMSSTARCGSIRWSSAPVSDCRIGGAADSLAPVGRHAITRRTRP